MKNGNSASEREEEIHDFWDKNSIQLKSEKGARRTWYEKFLPRRKFRFFDGPPFANGLPHYGHLLVSVVKDTILRYKTMQGFIVERRWGWDCHGLPVENEVEKKLKLTSKQEIIDKIGIKEFNKKARDSVLEYADEWKAHVARIGRWVDMDNAYKTMDTPYIESTWDIFNRIYKKGLARESFSILHICPRCETPLSNFEVAQSYKDIKEKGVWVEFPLKDKSASLIAWTTTPWTLPGNAALAVSPEGLYVKVTIKNKSFIVAKKALHLFGDEVVVDQEMKGASLVSKKYTPPFQQFYNEKDKRGWKIYGAEYVDTNEGSGVVHIAPAFGADDFLLAQQNKIPLIHHIDKSGKFIKEMKEFSGVGVKEKGVTEKIIKHLEKSKVLFKEEEITHSYPHCWRCETPLIYYATNSWIISMSKLRDNLVRENSKVMWEPRHLRDGRFGKWIENATDWCISRDRFWGSPLPIWKSDKEDVLVVDSMETLKSNMKPARNKFILVRHGESIHNNGSTISTIPGVNDALNEVGKFQSAETGVKIEKADVIITSEFDRATQTAEIIASKIGYKGKVIKDSLVNEVYVADEYQGKKWSDLISCYENGVTLDIEESIPDIWKRSAKFLYETDKKYEGKTIVVVTHKAVVITLKNIAEGKYMAGGTRKKVFTGQVPKASVHRISFKPLPCDDEYIPDLHRPYIDGVKLYKDGKEYTRVEGVFDCWFESGVMPYGSNRSTLGGPVTLNHGEEKVFPADLICESIDQTRGWFYSLLAVSVAAFGKTPYKAVLTTGHILSEDGKKLSKRLKNYTDPKKLLDEQGADALRYTFLSSPVTRGESVRFSYDSVEESRKKLIDRLHNCFLFYKNVEQKTHTSNVVDGLNIWMLSLIERTRRNMTKALNAYQVDRASKELAVCIEELSVWYIRRSREPLKEDSERGAEYREVLRKSLLTIAKLSAPIIPFYAEFLFQELALEGDEESVHLSRWPSRRMINKSILKDMQRVREIVSTAHEIRSTAQIKVRQPLASITLPLNVNLSDDLLGIIKDEVNVENVLKKDVTAPSLDTNITKTLMEKGTAREIIRTIQSLRKEAKCNVDDIINVSIHTNDEGAELIQEFSKEIRRKTNTKEMTILVNERAEVERIGHIDCSISLV